MHHLIATCPQCEQSWDLDFAEVACTCDDDPAWDLQVVTATDYRSNDA